MSDFLTPPRTLCILRLSAIGDVTHVVAIVRTLQRAWPDTAITWVIGRIEARLIGLLPGVELIIIDKRSLRAGALALRHDQPFPVEINRPERMVIQLVDPQGPHDSLLGNALVPESRQCRRIRVAERAESCHGSHALGCIPTGTDRE